MTTSLTNTDTVLLISTWKPLVMTGALVAWARVVTLIDDDLVYLSEPRRAWNCSQIIVGIAGFLVWLLAPQFWMGMLACLIATGSSIGCYIYYRNSRVPSTARWTMRSLLFPPGWDQAQRVWAKHAATLQLMNAEGHGLPNPVKPHPYAMAHCVFEQLLGYALAHRCERIFMKTNAQKADVVLLVDGVGYPQPRLEPAAAARLISYLKHVAGLDVSERRRKLLGRIRLITHKGTEHNLGLTTFGSLRGMELVIDVDRRSRPRLAVSQLGLMPTQEEQLTTALNGDNRVVLVAAPPGQGRTTILKSLLDRHDPQKQRITAVEENGDFAGESVNHHQLSVGTPESQYVDLITSLLEERPQVLLLEQLARNHQVARLLAASASEVRVYTSVQQTSTFDALQAWINAVGNGHTAAEALGVIIAGHLLRKLCMTCRQPYAPQTDTLKKLNLSANRIGNLYRHNGRIKRNHKVELCPDCLGLGYHGRVGVFEVLVIDDDSRRLIADREFEQLRIHLRQHKMLWLQEAALARAIEGTTSISELTRVLGQQPERLSTEAYETVPAISL